MNLRFFIEMENDSKIYQLGFIYRHKLEMGCFTDLNDIFDGFSKFAEVNDMYFVLIVFFIVL